jgi:hypothetical protein
MFKRAQLRKRLHMLCKVIFGGGFEQAFDLGGYFKEFLVFLDKII